MRRQELPMNIQMRMIKYYDYKFEKSYFNENKVNSTVGGKHVNILVEHFLPCYKQQ